MGAGLHRDQTPRLASEEAQHLIALQLLAEHDLASRIGPMRLENALRQIEPDRRNLAHGRLLLPAIRDGEVAMGESIDIMQYMMSVYGPTALDLKPGASRYADYLQFLVFGEGSMAAFLNPVFITLFTAPEDQKQNFTLEVAKDLFRGRLRSLDAQLANGDYLAGEFTAADISVGWSLDVAAGIGLDADYSPAVKSYRARLHARPAYQNAITS